MGGVQLAIGLEERVNLGVHLCFLFLVQHKVGLARIDSHLEQLFLRQVLSLIVDGH